MPRRAPRSRAERGPLPQNEDHGCHPERCRTCCRSVDGGSSRSRRACSSQPCALIMTFNWGEDPPHAVVLGEERTAGVGGGEPHGPPIALAHAAAQALLQCSSSLHRRPVSVDILPLRYSRLYRPLRLRTSIPQPNVLVHPLVSAGSGRKRSPSQASPQPYGLCLQTSGIRLIPAYQSPIAGSIALSRRAAVR